MKWLNLITISILLTSCSSSYKNEVSSTKTNNRLVAEASMSSYYKIIHLINSVSNIRTAQVSTNKYKILMDSLNKTAIPVINSNHEIASYDKTTAQTLVNKIVSNEIEVICGSRKFEGKLKSQGCNLNLEAFTIENTISAPFNVRVMETEKSSSHNQEWVVLLDSKEISGIYVVNHAGRALHFTEEAARELKRNIDSGDVNISCEYRSLNNLKNSLRLGCNIKTKIIN